ncbi:MAG: hypothetical protein ACREOU_13645 [Candidatus Eiseniibacteriota bacterium]
MGVVPELRDSVKTRGTAFGLTLVLAAALALRVVHLGRFSLWLDESATWWNASYATWRETFFAEVNHGPVWWIVTRAWIRLFGDGEASLRMPAALLGVVSVGLAYLLALRLLGSSVSRPEPHSGARSDTDTTAQAFPESRSLALLVAGLAALNGFWIEYSQEARMYTAHLAESLGMSLLMLRWVERRRASDLMAYSVLAMIALYTHYFAIWPILGHACFALLAGLRKRGAVGLRIVLGAALAQVVSLAAFLPWLLRTFSGPGGISSGGRFPAVERLLYSLWRMGVGPSLATVDRPRVDAGFTAFVREDALVIGATALVWASAIAIGFVRLRRAPRAFDFVASGLLVPVVGILAIYSRLPLMNEKFIIFLAPLLLLLAAVGAGTTLRGMRGLLLAGLITFHVLAVVAYHAPNAPGIAQWIVRGHPAGKEQWREAHAWVAARDAPGDAILLYPFYVNRSWTYYDRGRRPARELPRIPSDADELLRAAPELSTSRGGTLVLSHETDEERTRLLLLLARVTGASPLELDRNIVLFPRQWGVRVLRWEASAGSGSGSGSGSR